MHHADAGSQGVKGRAEADLLAVEEDIALIAAGFADHVHAEENFHEGALAGAVFAAETQDLAFLQGEVNVCQYLIAEEGFFNIPHLQKRSVCICHICYPPNIEQGKEHSPLPFFGFAVLEP